MAHSNFYLSYIRSDVWRHKCKQWHKRTNSRCCLFPWLKARHVHHLTYHHLGNEQLVRDVVPLSRTAHKLVHNKLLWKTYIRIIINYWLRLMCCILVACKII